MKRDEITVRDLRNRGANVLDRVTRGETLTVTRDGQPVAELRPLPPTPLAASALLVRWRVLPKIDPAQLRRDLDRILDPSIG